MPVLRLKVLLTLFASAARSKELSSGDRCRRRRGHATWGFPPMFTAQKSVCLGRANPKAGTPRAQPAQWHKVGLEVGASQFLFCSFAISWTLGRAEGEQPEQREGTKRGSESFCGIPPL